MPLKDFATFAIPQPAQETSPLTDARKSSGKRNSMKQSAHAKAQTRNKNQMRRLTDRNKIMKHALQSLPLIAAAVAFLLYGLTFLPISEDKMCRSAALVEHVSYYEITANGKPKAWFSAFGDSLSLRGISSDTGRDVSERRLIAGVWANRYAFMPSCRGRILVPAADTLAAEALAAANRNAAAVLQQAVSETEKLIAQLGKKQTKLRYYLSIHNVSDDGYNTMAAYSAETDSSRKSAESLLSALKILAVGGMVSFRHVEKYTLLYTDADGKAKRMACRNLTKDLRKHFRIIQTADQKLPANAVAQYFHHWLLPSLAAGTEVSVPSVHGCPQSKTAADSLRTCLCSGVIKAGGRHDIPTFFSPDGSALFTKGGRFAGVTVGGVAQKANVFSFGFNDLLP